MRRWAIILIGLALIFSLFSCDGSEKITIQFDTNGAGKIADLVIDIDTTNPSLPTPQKIGYTFDGWFMDQSLNEPFSVEKLITNRKPTLYAKWTKLADIEEVTITFNSNGGSLVGAYVFSQGQTITEPSAPTKIGSEFKGWYLEESFDSIFIFDVMPEANITLYAKWDVLSYQITFNSHGGSDVSMMTVFFGNEINKPEDPVKIGFVFKGWYKEESLTNLFVFDTMPANNLILHAKFEPIIYTMTFNSHGGSSVAEIKLAANEPISQPANPTKLGYVFDGWYKEESLQTPYVFSVMGNVNLTLHAKWLAKEVDVSVVIYKEALDKTFVMSSGVKVKGFTGDVKTILPSQIDGFTFDSVDNRNVLSLTIQPQNNDTFVLYYKRVSSKVFFDMAGLVSVASLEGLYEATYKLPIVAKEGYTFNGYFLTSEYVTPATNLTFGKVDQTLYGKFTRNNYQINFETNGGGDINPMSYLYDSPIGVLGTPEKEGYLFDGWYSDVNLVTLFSLSHMPFNDVTLYAKWVDTSNEEQIVFVLNKDIDSLVKVKGVIYYIYEDIDAFLIYDDTGFMRINANKINRVLGEEVSISGKVTQNGDFKDISMVTLISSLNINQDIKAKETLLYSDVIANNSLLNNGSYKVMGILSKEEQGYYLYDVVTFKRIHILDESLSTEGKALLDLNILEQIELSFIYQAKEDRTYLFNGFEVFELTLEAELNIVKTYYDTYFIKKTAFVGESFQIPQSDPLSLTTWMFSVGVETFDYLDFEERVFINVGQEIVIHFVYTFTSTKDSDVFVTLDVDVTVYPLAASPISEALVGALGNVYHISGVVVAGQDGSYIIFDDSGSMFLQTEEIFQIGDLISVKGLTISRENQVMMIDDGSFNYEIISNDNSIDLVPLVLSIAEFNQLDFTDPTLFGKYIQVRGFLIEPTSSDYHFNQLINESGLIYLESITYDGFEKLMSHDNLEVMINGFIGYSHNMVGLLYQGIRGDITIPTYTNEERANTIKELLVYQYQDRTFDAFEPHKFMPYHEYLGGHITYEFLTNPSIYDTSTHKFNYVLEDVEAMIKVVIHVGAETLEFNINVTLLKSEVVLMSDIENYDYQDILISGYISYHHPNYSYITDNLGNYLLVEDELDNYKVGDYVLLFGNIYKEGQSYKIRANYSDLPVVIELMSRDNQITQMPVEVSLYDLTQLDYNDPQTFNQFVTLNGVIESFSQTNVTIKTLDAIIKIDTPDLYTYQKLALYHGKHVSMNAMVLKVDYQQNLYVRFFGNAGDLSLKVYSEIEMLDIIEAYIENHFEKPILGNRTFSFNAPFALFNEGIFTYDVVDLDDVLDIVGNRVNQVLVDTVFEVTLTVNINDVVRGIPFTFTVLASSEVVVTSISDALLTTDEVTIEGQVIGVVDGFIDQTYIIALKDETGRIEADFSYPMLQAYNDYGSYGLVGDVLRLTGVVAVINNKNTFVIREVFVVKRNQVLIEDFVETDFSDYLQFDNELLNNHLMPVVLVGKLVKEATINGMLYYLADGDQKIGLVLLDTYNTFISSYEGYDVKVQGFVYGYHENFELDMVSLMVVKHPCGGRSIELSNYSDDDIVMLVSNGIYMEYGSYNPIRQINDYVSLPSLRMPFSLEYPDIIIEYEVTSGSLYVEENYSTYNNYLIMKYAPSDQEIEVTVTITLNNAITTSVLYYELNGFAYSSLDELFTIEDGLSEIAIKGTALLKGFGYLYIYIEGKVYCLDSYGYGYINEGNEVTIVGRKSLVNGVSDFTYEIFYFEGDYSTEEIPYLDIDVATVYETDFEVNNLYEMPLSLYGKLGYDDFMGLYTLSVDSNLIYIRRTAYGDEAFKSNLGRLVHVMGVLSKTLIRNEYMLLDTVGDDNSIIEADLTIEVQMSENLLYFANEVEDLSIFEGANLVYLQSLQLYQLGYITFELVDLLDEIYFDVFEMQSYFVNQDTIITLKAIFNGPDLMPEEIIFDVLIKKLDALSIKDVLLNSHEAVIKTTGKITYLSLVNNRYNLVISNGASHLVIKTDKSSLNDDTVIFNIGDDVMILGELNYTLSNAGIHISKVFDIKVDTNLNINTIDFMILSFEDVLDLDYLNHHGAYFVQMSGILKYTNGQYYLESETLYESTYYGNIYYKVLLIVNDENLFYNEHQTHFNLNVIVEGYVYLNNMNQAFNYDMYVVDVLVE